ncbi:MAG: MMPL family transporter [Desulfobacterales bacterium]|jgi:hypothetical protein
MAFNKEKIELRFARAGRWLYRNPLRVLTGLFIIIAFFAFHIPRITIDTSSEKLLHENDPSLVAYNNFRDQFGRAELIVIAIQPPNVFDEKFLHKLVAFHHALEQELPYLKEVSSLFNARNTSGNERELIVDDLLEGWPQRKIDLAALKQQVMNNPFYRNYLISADGRVTAVIVETEASVAEPVLDEEVVALFKDENGARPDVSTTTHYFSEKENREVVEAVKRVAARFNREDFSLTVSGGPVIAEAFNRATLADVKLCIVLAIAVVAFFLAILFRRLSGILLPLLIIGSSLVSTLGLMALLNVPIKLTTTVIPAFLISVGVCDAVHVLAIFYRQFGQCGDKQDAIAFALQHSGIAIVMTSLTTIAGLLSFSFAELTAIAEIGFFAASGVMLALLYSIVMLPALLALTPIKTRRKIFNKSLSFDRFLGAIAKFSTHHPLKIIGVGALFFGVFFPAVFSLKVSHNIVRYFPDDMPYRRDINFIDSTMKGTITLEVVVDTGSPNGIHDPWVLNGIEKFRQISEEIKRGDIFIGKVFSVTDVLKEIHQALNENNPSFYRIPQDRNVVAQEFLLFENTGSDDLQRIVDSQFAKARVTIKSPWVDAVVCRDFIADVDRTLKTIFQDKAAFHTTGLMALLARAITAAIYSMARSYVIAFVAITILMILLMGDLKMGLISMIPNVLPVLITMGIMGWTNTPVDINSLMIGSIALGVVVDDTVHFMYNFQRYYQRTSSPHHAVRETLLGTGRALLITSLVLSAGFFILLASSLNHLIRFGFFTGITILIALAADFLLLPALMMRVTRKA